MAPGQVLGVRGTCDGAQDDEAAAVASRRLPGARGSSGHAQDGDAAAVILRAVAGSSPASTASSTAPAT